MNISASFPSSSRAIRDCSCSLRSAIIFMSGIYGYTIFLLGIYADTDAYDIDLVPTCDDILCDHMLNEASYWELSGLVNDEPDPVVEVFSLEES